MTSWVSSSVSKCWPFNSILACGLSYTEANLASGAGGEQRSSRSEPKKTCMLGWHTMAFWQAVLVVSTECVTSAASGHYSKTQCLQSHSGWHIHSPRYHDCWKNKHKGSTPTVWLLTFHAAFWLSVHSLQLSFIYVTPNHSGRCLKEIYVVR